MSSILNSKNITLNIVEMRHVILGKSWNFSKRSLGLKLFPYVRIYFPVDGSGTLQYKDQTVNMTKGKMYLIAAMSNVNQKCDNRLEKYYMHFSLLVDGVQQEFFLFRPGVTEITIDNFDFVKQLFELAIHGSQQQNSYIQKLQMDSAAKLIISYFLQDLEQNIESISQHTLMNLLFYIHANLDKKLTLQNLASYSGLNPAYLSRLFHKQFSIRLFEYINYYRTLSTLKYLLSNQYSIGEIADMTGFTNVAMLSKSFKQHFGVSPAAYRRVMKENPEEFNRDQYP